MQMLEKLNLIPMLRPMGVPENLHNISLICLQVDVRTIEKFLAAYSHIKIALLIIPDLDPVMIDKIKINLPTGEKIGLSPNKALSSHPEYEKVFICPMDEDLVAITITDICRYLAIGSSSLYLYSSTAPAYSLRNPLPNFYRENSSLLEQVYSLWADQQSRDTYIGRIKALLTGNAAYIPIAAHEEYFHPLVSPQPGDIMIDGGVSDMVEVQEQFVNAIGREGRIYGFEPIPSLAAIAAAKLNSHKNYILENFGLAEKPGRAVFDDMRDSSRLDASKEEGAPGTVVCQLESIDTFCKKNNLTRIDCIKLDIEGSELSALRGAAETIKKYRPRLIICLYHKPEDMTEIPLYIKSLVPDYELYLSHCSCQFIDTILYAR